MGAVPAHAQAPQKMPVPVEDDTNAPSAMRGSKSEPAPQTPQREPEPRAPYSQAMVDYKAGNYDKALAALKGIDPNSQDDNFAILEAAILTELKRYDDGEKVLRSRLAAPINSKSKARWAISCSTNAATNGR